MLLRTNSINNSSISNTPTFQDKVLGSAAIREHAPTTTTTTTTASKSLIGSQKQQQKGSR